jgi:hypothetical protein
VTARKCSLVGQLVKLRAGCLPALQQFRQDDVGPLVQWGESDFGILL